MYAYLFRCACQTAAPLQTRVITYRILANAQDDEVSIPGQQLGAQSLCLCLSSCQKGADRAGGTISYGCSPYSAIQSWLSYHMFFHYYSRGSSASTVCCMQSHCIPACGTMRPGHGMYSSQTQKCSWSLFLHPCIKVISLLLLQEVYLLKRDPDSMVIEDTWHAEGPFEGNTLSTPPVWAGTWLIDVLVCIHDCEFGRSFWLKAMHRNVPVTAPTQ